MSRTSGSPPFPQRARSLAVRQHGSDVTTAEQTIAVRAWIVTTKGDDVEVDAEAEAWTHRAVRIRYTDRFGYTDTAWVWAGAVARRPA